MNDNHATDIVVLGGGYAGVVAALRLSRKTRGEGMTITLVNGSDHFVERIRFHQRAANEDLSHLPFADLLAGTGVRFVQGWVTGLSPERQTVTLQRPTGEVHISYDYLVYALGSKVDTSAVPGAKQNAMSLSTEETTLALQEQLPEVARRGGRLVVCGGGLTGIEAATELAEAYDDLRVALVTRGTFGDHLSRRGQRHLRAVFDRVGIEVLDNRNIGQIYTRHVEIDDGSTVPFDICLWAGSFAVSPLAQKSGLPVNAHGQVVVDEHLRAKTWTNVYAIGDAASLEEAVDIPIRMACATATPMAQYVGNHLAAEVRNGPSPTPYRFRYFIRCISLGRQDGVIQFVNAADEPKAYVLTGRLASGVKELVCRSTIWNMAFERKAACLLSRPPMKGTIRSELADRRSM